MMPRVLRESLPASPFSRGQGGTGLGQRWELVAPTCTKVKVGRLHLEHPFRREPMCSVQAMERIQMLLSSLAIILHMALGLYTSWHRNHQTRGCWVYRWGRDKGQTAQTGTVEITICCSFTASAVWKSCLPRNHPFRSFVGPRRAPQRQARFSEEAWYGCTRQSVPRYEESQEWTAPPLVSKAWVHVVHIRQLAFCPCSAPHLKSPCWGSLSDSPSTLADDSYHTRDCELR